MKDNQIKSRKEELLLICENTQYGDFLIAIVDEIEELYPDYNFQIGYIGSIQKIAKVCRIDKVFDEGKTGIQRASDTIQDALIKVIKEFPKLIKQI